MIRVAYYFLKKLNILENIQLKNKHYREIDSRNNFIKEIRSYFNKNKKKLSSDSLKRLDRNPLRILDSKNSEDKELLKKPPIIFNFLSQDELKCFENVKVF